MSHNKKKYSLRDGTTSTVVSYTKIDMSAADDCKSSYFAWQLSNRWVQLSKLEKQCILG